MLVYKFISVLFVIIISLVRGLYNKTLAEIGVRLSGAAYCGKDNYKSMNLTGIAKNFIVTSELHDKFTDLQGFIGYLDTSKSIHIVFRGSSSLLNWLDDLQIRQVEYTTFPECNCMVHNGFYKATLGIREQTIKHLKLLQKQKHGYNIFINGHSLGFGVGDLIAMELYKEGIISQAYGYGKPRVGNLKYSQFFNSKISEHYRHTHAQDIIPHLPPITGLNYYHSCQEIFEDLSGNLMECSQIDCEDESCGNQYSLSQTNIDDHLYYLSHRVSCEHSTE